MVLIVVNILSQIDVIYQDMSMSNRAEKDAVRWCHLTHQVFAGHSREHKTSLVRCTDILSKRLINHSIIIYNNLRAEKYTRHTFYA